MRMQKQRWIKIFLTKTVVKSYAKTATIFIFKILARRTVSGNSYQTATYKTIITWFFFLQVS